MQLAVNKFFDYQPASKWAFEVDFSNPMLVSKKASVGRQYQYVSTDTFTTEELERISQAVVSITQPKFTINEPYTNCYGNFDFVVPLYDTNNIRLTITFEDTDDCLISYKFLTSLMGGSVLSDVPAWLNVHETILITIREYDTYDYDYARPNSYAEQKHNWNETSTKHYFCRLIEYTEPDYNRNSDDPKAATLTMTFLAVPAYITLVNNQAVVTNGVEEVNIEEVMNAFLKEAENVYAGLKDLAGTLFGWMSGAVKNPEKYDLKDVYNSMVKQIGVPTSRGAITEWWSHYALAKDPQGQCSRGYGMLAQLIDYFETAEKPGVDSRHYKPQPAADLVGKGVGVSQQFKDSVFSDDDAMKAYGNRKLTEQEMNEFMKTLRPGQYVTFKYNYTENAKKKHDPTKDHDSQHIVMRTFNIDRKDYFSDTLQWSPIGVSGGAGTDFIITGIFTMKDRDYEADRSWEKQNSESVLPMPIDKEQYQAYSQVGNEVGKILRNDEYAKEMLGEEGFETLQEIKTEYNIPKNK